MAEKVQHSAKTAEVKRENSASKTRAIDYSQSMSSPADQVLYLQRTIGNQAVQRLIKSGTLQAKLRIGQPGDKYEQEADRVADAVMRMPEPGVQRQVDEEEEEEETLQTKTLANQITPLVQVQQQEEPEEEEEMLQAKPLAEEITHLVQRQVEPEEEEEEIQAKATSGRISEVNSNLESHIQSFKGGGQPLSENDRAFFEPRFGYDFGQVRMHTDSQAAESAKMLNAQAFTMESGVAFAEGEYAPETANGRQLLAHELTHTIQQVGAEIKGLLQRKSTQQEDPRIGRINSIVQEELDRFMPSYKVMLQALYSAKKIGGLQQLVDDLRARPYKMHSTYFIAMLRTIRNSGSEDLFNLTVRFLAKEGIALDRIELAKEIADPSAVMELARRIDILREKLITLPPDTTEYKSIESYVLKLEEKMLEMKPAQPERGKEKGAYPKDVALLTSYLLRGGYIRTVAGLIPGAWRSMSEGKLTALLSEKFTVKELRVKFLEKYEARAATKARFRKYNIVAALVLGLIWARENIVEGEWETAAAKISSTGIAAWAFNRLLYARDLPAEAIMRLKGKAFGRWFQGVARTSIKYNFLIRRVGGALLILDLRELLMSGGGEGPTPLGFDLIDEIDIDDPSTWVEPDKTLLDFGFNIWYSQKCTQARPEACTATPIYLAKVEGSMLWGIAKLLDIAPHEVPRLKKKLYRIEGERVSAAENVLVVATGERSGEMISGRGHYREQKVIPANKNAVDLFGGSEPRFVPEYLLHKIEL